MKIKSEKGYFIGGPHAAAIVYHHGHIEPVIKALCEATGDTEDDYTATDLDNPYGRPLEAVNASEVIF